MGKCNIKIVQKLFLKSCSYYVIKGNVPYPNICGDGMFPSF